MTPRVAKATLRAYEEDQQFAARTYVAIAADNLDPCDLRLRDGDQGVRDLVAARTPLFEFVLRSSLAELDLRTAEGRAPGSEPWRPVIAGMKDATLRPEYARQVAGWLGTDTDQVMQAVSALKPARRGLVPPPAAAVRARAQRTASNSRRSRSCCNIRNRSPTGSSRWTPTASPTPTYGRCTQSSLPPGPRRTDRVAHGHC